jgi:lysophospholipase L1-like esterase
MKSLKAEVLWQKTILSVMRKLEWLFIISCLTVGPIFSSCEDVEDDVVKPVLVNPDTIKVPVSLNTDTLKSSALPSGQKPSINLIFDGDSQTKRGYYPLRIEELLKKDGYTSLATFNFGVSGQTTSQMVSDVATQVVPKYNRAYKINIVCYWIGGNDAIKDEKTDTAKLYKYLLTYYTTLKKAGFKVVLIALPDALHRAGTNKINAMYDRAHSKISDVYVDCREKSGVFEQVTNPTYYADAAGHLSKTGYYYMADKYIYPKLKQLISSIKY